MGVCQSNSLEDDLEDVKVRRISLTPDNALEIKKRVQFDLNPTVHEVQLEQEDLLQNEESVSREISATPKSEPSEDDKALEKEPEEKELEKEVEAEPEKKEAIDPKAILSANFVVDYKHMLTKIHEFSDDIKVNDSHKPDQLLPVFEKCDISKEDLDMWQLWSGKFTNKADAKGKLSTVCEYGWSKAEPDIKVKFQVVTKLILERGTKDKKVMDGYKHVLLLLASHGNVCNVMKDIAIQNAYGMMTETLTDQLKKQDLEQQILRELRDYRIDLVERLFAKFKFNTNQHTVNGFFNEIAPHIGLRKYRDEHLGSPYGTNANHYKKGLKERFCTNWYTKEGIIKRIRIKIDEKKIGYQKIVAWFEKNCPKEMKKTELLQQAIDIDTGEIKEDYLVWCLAGCGIFERKPADWKEQEKVWDDIV